jgi:hypothetical protein
MSLPKAIDKPYVILKLDDLLYEEDSIVHQGWQQCMDFLNEEKVIGTIGVICKSLETNDQKYFDWIRLYSEVFSRAGQLISFRLPRQRFPPIVELQKGFFNAG